MKWERFCGRCGAEPLFCECECECCPKPDDAEGYEGLIVEFADRLIAIIELFLEQETWKSPGRGCFPYPDPALPHIRRPLPDAGTNSGE